MRRLPWCWMGLTAGYAAIFTAALAHVGPWWLGPLSVGGWTALSVGVTWRETRRDTQAEWADQVQRLEWKNARLWAVLGLRTRRRRKPPS